MTVANTLNSNRLWAAVFLLFGMLAGSVHAATGALTNENVIVLDVENMT